MGNNHESTRRKDATSKQANKQLPYYPWLLLTALLLISLGIAAFASYNLIQVGDVVLEEPDQVIEEPVAMPPKDHNPTPLWMLATIALSCSVGCWLILRLLKHPEESRKSQKRSQGKKPPQENHPPDSKTESLADLLDID
jgi:hypothetical protein